MSETRKAETRKTETRERDSLMRLIETFQTIGLPYEQVITAAYMQGFHSGRDMGICIGKTLATRDAART